MLIERNRMSPVYYVCTYDVENCVLSIFTVFSFVIKTPAMSSCSVAFSVKSSSAHPYPCCCLFTYPVHTHSSGIEHAIA